MAKPSAPATGDNTSAPSSIRPVSPTVAADALIVDKPAEKLDVKKLPITRTDSMKLDLPAAVAPVRREVELPPPVNVPGAGNITRQDR